MDATVRRRRSPLPSPRARYDDPFGFSYSDSATPTPRHFYGRLASGRWRTRLHHVDLLPDKPSSNHRQRKCSTRAGNVPSKGFSLFSFFFSLSVSLSLPPSLTCGATRSIYSRVYPNGAGCRFKNGFRDDICTDMYARYALRNNRQNKKVGQGDEEEEAGRNGERDRLRSDSRSQRSRDRLSSVVCHC